MVTKEKPGRIVRQTPAQKTNEAILQSVAALVEPLGMVFPGRCEVVLHDLARIPTSIIAIYGNLTNRQVGDPATDYLLEQNTHGFQTAIGYGTRMDDGTVLRSSTIIIRNIDGAPIGALCFNVDVSIWRQVELIARQIQGGLAHHDSGTAEQEPQGAYQGPPAEKFPSDIDELAAFLLHSAIRTIGIPVAQMKKEQKLEIVRNIKSRGFFMIREAAELAAEALEVSRFTIYNYLNEIIAEDDEHSTKDERPEPREHDNST